MRLGFLVSGRGRLFGAVCQAAERGILGSEVVVCVVDRPCEAIQMAQDWHVPVTLVKRKDYSSREEFSDKVLEVLVQHGVDLVLLTFDSLLSGSLLRSFEGRIVNFHPALLPAFKGFKALQSAVDTKVTIGGGTLHLVDETMDGGRIILQWAVPLYPHDNSASYGLRVFEQGSLGVIQAVKWFEEGRVKVSPNGVAIEGGTYGTLPHNPALEWKAGEA